MELGSLTTLELPIQLQVLSSTPGRVRVRLGEAWRDPDRMATIVQSLTPFVPALRRVKTSPAIGTLTLYFDPSQDSGEALFERLSAMGLIALSSSALPSAAQRLTHLTDAWNQRINQWTEGTADLRFLVPMALAILALRRFMVNGNGLKSAPWYILAWYAFDSFMKLNPNPASPSTREKAVEPAAVPPPEEPSRTNHSQNGGVAQPKPPKRARSKSSPAP
ncbi:MAG TPA: hypothetical protein IGR64_12845 [Leptolyngbyaceae cyanobacterium M65_K2018_010]|nr:hypothetical protein [Leptolyngbyaceae cyanobacterium M65_K2018_010]